MPSDREYNIWYGSSASVTPGGEVGAYPPSHPRPRWVALCRNVWPKWAARSGPRDTREKRGRFDIGRRQPGQCLVSGMSLFEDPPREQRPACLRIKPTGCGTSVAKHVERKCFEPSIACRCSRCSNLLNDNILYHALAVVHPFTHVHPFSMGHLKTYPPESRV